MYRTVTSKTTSGTTTITQNSSIFLIDSCVVVFVLYANLIKLMFCNTSSPVDAMEHYFHSFVQSVMPLICMYFIANLSKLLQTNFFQDPVLQILRYQCRIQCTQWQQLILGFEKTAPCYKYRTSFYFSFVSIQKYVQT